MPDYQEIYLRNSYEVELSVDSTFTFSLIDFQDNIFYDRPFAIITAFNPQNKALPYQENRLRNQILYSELNSRYELITAKGCLNGHCEEGYLVFDISLPDATAIGSKYEQFALFFNSSERLSYIRCEDKKIIVTKER
ncbi:MAG: DUF3293 domain-containing protein [Sulfurimonadaceae bacterium]